MNDDAYHTRFWSTWLHHAVFFSGISFTAMFFLSGQITAFAGWNTVIRRVWESMSQFMWVGIILMGLDCGWCMGTSSSPVSLEC
jgi:hypothetical protein